MRVRLLDQEGKEVDAEIRENSRGTRLPSLQEGWRFNFPKHAKAKGARTYVLVTCTSPAVIEGCVIYKMLNETEPYMAFIELAPHNRGKGKRYDRVAGCLIAFACRLSFILGEGPYKGWLAFDVQEPDKKEEIRLMAHYCTQYKAKRLAGTTTLVISPEDGEALIDRYLR